MTSYQLKETNGRKPEPLATDSNPAESLPQASLVAVHVSTESDFAADLHQMIPLEPCYSPPLQPTANGSFEMHYDGAVMVTDLEGMYYFESGYFWAGYTNPCLRTIL